MVDTHSFNVQLATVVGLKDSILLQHFWFWHLKNKANKKHIYDGSTWTYNSIHAFTEIFPYLSQKEIRGCVDRLTENGYIIKGNYNKLKMDKTLWYALTEKTIELFQKRDSEQTDRFAQKANAFDKRANGDVQKGEPIPVSNTVSNTDKKESVDESTTQTPFELKVYEFKKSLFKFTNVKPHTGKYSKQLVKEFFDYWSEPNKSKTKMRYELERTWDVERRLAKWDNNNFNKNKEVVKEIIRPKTETTNIRPKH